ncbi:DapH/DapD/GlmU-related protein [Oerskovia flava]|uniref:DapH/DapD/GlmU-related protein n=1 Tax=Oerskovia flava TaxID=2986422 RepID=UPI0022407385|nr:DapH/DapD/GlmU-related protein [Oerskovia sp. JB1-3-2]
MDFRVGRFSVISAPHRLEIGDSVSIGPWSIVEVDGTIGDFCLIGQSVQIIGRDDHAIDEVGVPVGLSTWVAEREETARDRVTIGRDVWIGGATVVLSGISIGEGAIIGAGSVVTRDVPPYGVAVGSPARVVRQRFGDPDAEVRHSRELDRLAQELRSRASGAKKRSPGA